MGAAVVGATGQAFSGDDLSCGDFRLDAPGEDFSADPYYRAPTRGLRRADLSNANFAGANFTQVDLGSANLTCANLTGANFTRAVLLGANLTRANLTGANFTRASLLRANLTHANLTGANFTGTFLGSANLTGAIFSNTVCVDGTVTNTGC